MSTHTATVRWQNSGPDFLNRRYSREHTLHFDGGAVVPGSPSPCIVAPPWSNAAAVDPEEAYVVSVASCHMLWFLHVAVDAGFEAASYEDRATGHLMRNEQGKRWISRITLNPRVEWRGSRLPTTAEVAELHHRAHEECFIANSIRTEVVVASP
jgi:organic hydroperoxide reductase OsmC/OhrA